MTPQQPPVDLHLPNGTHLTLYKDVTITRNKNNVKVVGDYLIALVPGEPRAVLYFYQKYGKQIVEMVYDKLPYDDKPTDPPDGAQLWTLCSIDNPADVKKYTKLYDAIKNHP